MPHSGLLAWLSTATLNYIKVIFRLHWSHIQVTFDSHSDWNLSGFQFLAAMSGSRSDDVTAPSSPSFFQHYFLKLWCYFCILLHIFAYFCILLHIFAYFCIPCIPCIPIQNCFENDSKVFVSLSVLKLFVWLSSTTLRLFSLADQCHTQII